VPIAACAGVCVRVRGREVQSTMDDVQESASDKLKLHEIPNAGDSRLISSLDSEGFHR